MLLPQAVPGWLLGSLQGLLLQAPLLQGVQGLHLRDMLQGLLPEVLRARWVLRALQDELLRPVQEGLLRPVLPVPPLLRLVLRRRRAVLPPRRPRLRVLLQPLHLQPTTTRTDLSAHASRRTTNPVAGLACPYFCPLPCNLTDEQLEAVDVGTIHIKPVVTKKPLDGLDAPLNIEMKRDSSIQSEGGPVHLVDGVRSDDAENIP